MGGVGAGEEAGTALLQAASAPTHPAPVHAPAHPSRVNLHGPSTPLGARSGSEQEPSGPGSSRLGAEVVRTRFTAVVLGTAGKPAWCHPRGCLSLEAQPGTLQCRLKRLEEKSGVRQRQGRGASDSAYAKALRNLGKSVPPGQRSTSWTLEEAVPRASWEGAVA